ncbi:MAG: Uma2 family endonuclease, partial [Chthoniobacteraceae bacterium]
CSKVKSPLLPRMVIPEKKPYISPEEYLRLERAAEYKSEYYAGEIFAMAGGKLPHSLIAMNAGAELRTHLRGKGCVPYDSNLRILIPATGLYTYPDVSVICGPPEFAPDTDDTIVNPTLLVEVLSDSTEAYDRGKKFEHYRSIPSFREYVLISQAAASVEVFSEQTSGNWMLTHVKGIHASARLQSLDIELSLAEIYYEVQFPEQPPLKTLAS